MEQLFNRFPDFKTCFEEVVYFRDAARKKGRKAEIISSGLRGFRLLLSDDDSNLFIVVKGQSGRKDVSDLVKARFKSYFGVETFPASIDFSVYGWGRGLRTSLSNHPCTKLWPRVIDVNSSDYAGREQCDKARDYVKTFWENCIAHLPVLEREEEKEEEGEDHATSKKQHKRKRSDNDMDQTTITQLSDLLCKRYGCKVEREILNPSSNYGVFIVKDLTSKMVCQKHKDDLLHFIVNLTTHQINGPFCSNIECRGDQSYDEALDLKKLKSEEE